MEIRKKYTVTFNKYETERIWDHIPSPDEEESWVGDQLFNTRGDELLREMTSQEVVHFNGLRFVGGIAEGVMADPDDCIVSAVRSGRVKLVLVKGETNEEPLW
jgi:hypothetical protein